VRDEARLIKSGSAAARRVLALKPLSTPSNDYAGLFSGHIDAERFDCVGFEWEELGRGRYDLVAFHWPTEFFRPSSRKATLKLLGRMLRDRLLHGTKFAWVVHNLEPHDGGSMRSDLTAALFVRLLSGVILLSEHTRGELYRLYPSTRSLPALVTVLGSYPSANPPLDAVSSERRNRLLCFGLIRDYKNIERLVAEARRIETAPFSLTVLGCCTDAELEKRIRAAAGDDARIVLDIRKEFVPGDELERAIDAADAVILPYRRILNSAVALHSLGRNRPILAPAIGSLPELQGQVGREWVHLFEDEISAASIETFLAALAHGSAPRPDLSRFDWREIGADVTRFLQELKP
jgi:glycosyltransferase involved in cell wall biosynthesis